MNANRKSSLVTGGLAAVLAACAAQADVITFKGTVSNRWHDPLNWDLNEVPDADDRAVIEQGEDCVIDGTDATVQTIEVQQGATLTVNPSRTMTLVNKVIDAQPLGGGSIGDTLVDSSIAVDGRLYLMHNATLKIEERGHTFAGAGVINGFISTVEIVVDENLTLVNELAGVEGGMKGSFTMRAVDTDDQDQTISPATFINKGIVESDDKAMILETTIEIADIQGAEWRVAACAIMNFQQEALGLEGDFFHLTDHSIFDFDESIKTCGVYWRAECGGFELASGATFEYAHIELGPSCDNPGQVIGPPACSNPYVIDRNVDPGPCPGGG